jgi:hypothetical protein
VTDESSMNAVFILIMLLMLKRYRKSGKDWR